MADEVLEDTDTTGADLTYHHLPDRPPWVDVIRSPGLLWLLAMFAVNTLALYLAMGVHGAGFDDCEVMPTASDRLTIALIAGAAVVVPAGLALWKLRGWARVAALGCVGLSALAWLILVAGNQNCSPT